MFRALLLVGLACLSAHAADLNLADLSGKPVHLKDLRGKIAVINFWATWCGPCKAEMPLLVEASRKWAGKGVALIAASLDENTSDIAEFITKYRIDFPIWTGATEKDLENLNLGESLPATAFFDRDGAILLRVQGGLDRIQLETRLVWLTGKRAKRFPQPLLRTTP